MEKTEREYTKELVNLGMKKASIRYYTSRGYSLAEIYETAVELIQKDPHIDLNADVPGEGKGEDHRKKTAAVYAQTRKINKAVDAALTLAQEGQPEQAMAVLRTATKAVAARKPYLTQKILEDWLTENGIELRLNMVTHDVDSSGVSTLWPDLTPESCLNMIPIKLSDLLQDTYARSATSNIADLLSVIADEHHYNPVLDLITAESWTTKSRNHLEDLKAALGVSSEFESILLEKWLLQAIALLHNGEVDRSGERRDYSADGILVLIGPQGVGKTSTAEVLGLQRRWTLTGAYLDSRDKDTLIRTTSYFITELGELETTIKRIDVERLKSFITSPNDIYRRPYARTDTKTPRRTSFIATANGTEILADPTGSRRFWILDVPFLDVVALRQVDALGVWRQMYAVWKAFDVNGEGGTCYRLTKEERAMLEERNAPHKKPVKGQIELEDIFHMVSENPDAYEWDWITVSEFMEEFEILKRFETRVLGAALDVLGYECKKTKRKGSKMSERLRYLPHKLL